MTEAALRPAAQDEDEQARTRRAMLHILEDLQRERDALRGARTEWIATVDAVRHPLMVHDAAGRIVRANRAYAEHAGMPFPELVGRRYWECFPKGEGPLEGCDPAALPPGAGNDGGEREFSLISGEVFVARVFGVPRAGDEKQVLHLFENVTERRRAEAALRDNQARLRRALVATIEVIAATIEARDPYTAGHQRRVADLARAIGAELGLAENELEGLHFGALIHDLGKIQVPAELLSKPTRLSKAELELIKVHPEAGYEIVRDIEFPWPVAAMVYQHHERLDGSGYPQGLKGDAIAREARILAVADVVEAMASHRPYRPGLGLDAALREIEEKRGTAFDPAVVDACLRLFRDGRFSL